MAGQPFHRMAPVPPHLTYKPEISTYMDHFRVPRQPPRRRNIMPQQFLMQARAASATQKETRRLDSSALRPQPKMSKVKTTVKDYMDSMLKMTGNDFPVYNARVDVPCKSAQPTNKQRRDLQRIARTGYGISGTEARDIVRKDRSVDFYHEHNVTSSNPVPDRSAVKSAPGNTMHFSPKKATSNIEPHWITWNSGTPEPPGLQKRLHRPWPTPEPPKTPKAEAGIRCASRSSQYSNAAVARPASGTLLPTNPTQPVPDMIGSDGTHPTLTKAREQVYTPQPATLPVSRPHSKRTSYPLACVV